MPSERSFVCPPELAGQRLDRFLATAADIPRGVARRAIEAGAVRRNGAPASVAAELVDALDVIVLGEAPPTPAPAGPPPLVVIDEDDDLLVVAKPAGLLSVRDGHGEASLLDAVQVRLADLGLAAVAEVHRLDRGASGLMVFAKNRRALMALNAALQARALRRGYLVWVRAARPLAATRIDAPLRTTGDGGVAVHPTGRPATTRLEPLAHADGVALAAIALETGRMHQIRAHLAWAIGPVVGDRRYGDPDAVRHGRLALHAARLGLLHPRDGRPRVWTLPPPDDVAALVGAGLAPPPGWEDVLAVLSR